MKFFIQTTHFVPDSYESFNLVKITDDLYQMKSDNSLWIKRKLFDLGWGRETGFCRLPLLSFDELINLAFVSLDKDISDKTYNYWGAVSVLLDDYCHDLICFFESRCEMDKFFIAKHIDTFNYIDAELNISESLIPKLSDKKLAMNCIRWKKFRSSIEQYLLS